jgi:glutamate synthase (NADPH/NADH) small chain
VIWFGPSRIAKTRQSSPPNLRSEKPGGLNEYGIAAYKTVDGFARAETEWVLRIGGVSVEHGRALGRDFSLADLRRDFDAVFLGIGLGGVNAPGIEGADLSGVEDAVDFIARLRQAEDLAAVPVGRDVVVIGGGMTAIDAGVQCKLLGAENSTIVYRRGRARMGASGWEQDLAASKGVVIRHHARPVRVLGENGAARAVEFERTEDGPDGLRGTGETFKIPADQVLFAIGQTLAADGLEGLKIERGKIAVEGRGRASLPGVWAGGDCAAGGEDLTVTAVAEGRDAAEDIHRALTGG